ncbi:Piso0_002714 [Millerozyma farinosa CBS 7064]|uniref:Piso0_002714 protein n=1 Tax=Pichia sorbitophila (strain ATCC MYA-4447 / BCRC 22081 / CBS 7064 / NBRC 10061 / NRRL Y-12695) TaxID=559304 RepID=G8YFS2_PICSO|nr:Piso0_002714 [Millerozyma farinosa CBS 7064]
MQRLPSAPGCEFVVHKTIARERLFPGPWEAAQTMGAGRSGTVRPAGGFTPRPAVPPNLLMLAQTSTMRNGTCSEVRCNLYPSSARYFPMALARLHQPSSSTKTFPSLLSPVRSAISSYAQCKSAPGSGVAAGNVAWTRQAGSDETATLRKTQKGII